MELKLNFSRSIATFFTIIFFILFSLFILFFIGFYIFDETLVILQMLPQYINELLKFGEILVNNIVLFFNTHILSLFNNLPEHQQTVIMKYVNDLVGQYSNQSTQFFNTIINQLTNIFTSFSYTITIFLFIIISLFFMTKDFHHIKNLLDTYTPPKITFYINSIVLQFKRGMIGFLKAQVIITFITFVIVFICLTLFKVEHAVTISFFSFFIDFIPYLGIGLLFVPWIIYSFFTTEYVMTIQLASLYIAIIILRQLIEPKIIAQSIGINPLIALIILFISITKWGIAGIMISPFILIIISTIHQAGITQLVWNYIRG